MTNDNRINTLPCLRRNIPKSLVLVAALLLSLPAQANKQTLSRIASLDRGGAPNLALNILKRSQPPASDLENWLAFEKLRYRIMQSQQQWQAIINRTQQLPQGLPADFLRWARLQAALAALQSRQGSKARYFLRQLIWDSNIRRPVRARARRLVIRSYLLDNRTNDALVALHRYLLDYKPRSVSWRLLQASVLLQAGKNKDAFAVLSGVQIYQGNLLRQLAGMRANIYRANVVMIRSENIARRVASKPALQKLALHVLADAARQEGNPVIHIRAVESALALDLQNDLYTRQVPLDADSLWRAYLGFAEQQGNEIGLVVGDDEAWLQQAAAFKAPEKQRAFYAFLSFKASTKQTREKAHKLLSDALLANGQVNTLIALYTKSKKFNGLGEVPSAVRFRLANVALQRYEIRLAATLMKGLNKPPEGKDRNVWLLQQARILIYAGDYSDAIGLLRDILQQGKALDDKFLARYVQVMFDLQVAGKNYDAYDLLLKTYKVTRNKNSRREILFWMADSQYALGDYVKAAELYLRSTTYTVRTGGDIWGQTARFKAAEALGKAGLVKDARSVYLKLLQFTHDAKRRAIIERNIQQLWLYKKNNTRR